MNLHRATEAFIHLKQSLGYRFRTESYILRAFSKRMGNVSMGQVKSRAVRTFLAGHGPVTRTCAQKWSILNRFYRFAQTRGLVQRSPLPAQAPKVTTTFKPHIYTLLE